MKKLLLLVILAACTPAVVNECEQEASLLIPDSLNLYWDMGTMNRWQIIPFTWNDGEKVSFPDALYYYKGSKAGENIESFYPSNETAFNYNGSNLSFSVVIAVKPTGMEGVHEVDNSKRFKSQVFSVEKKMFLECQKLNN